MSWPCMAEPLSLKPKASKRLPASPGNGPAGSKAFNLSAIGAALTLAGPATREWHHFRALRGRRDYRPYAPQPLLPGADPDPAQLLGGLWLRHPAALRHGSRRRHFSSGNDAARAWAKTLERRLCPALAPAQGRALWRESEPAAALLPVPGDPEAQSAQFAGALSRLAQGDRRRSAAARYPLRRGRLGKPDAGRLGAGLGVLVRRHGSVAVHLFPAGLRHRMRAGGRRADLRAGAAGHVCARRRQCLRP